MVTLVKAAMKKIKGPENNHARFKSGVVWLNALFLLWDGAVEQLEMVLILHMKGETSVAKFTFS